MINYNRQTMVRMINHDKVLCAIYLQYCDESDDDMDIALERLFNERIRDEQLEHYTSKWHELSDKSTNGHTKVKPNFIESRPVLTEIEKLINLFGWKRVIEGLRDYSENQSKWMYLSGMESRQREWEKIADTFKKIKKNVQE